MPNSALSKPRLTEPQFTLFRQLAALMDGGSLSPAATACRAYRARLPWRSIRALTGLNDAQLYAALEQ